VWKTTTLNTEYVRHSTERVTFFNGEPTCSEYERLVWAQMASGVDGKRKRGVGRRLKFKSDISFQQTTDQGATFSTRRNLQAKNSGNSFGAHVAVDLSGNSQCVDGHTPGNNDILFTH